MQDACKAAVVGGRSTASHFYLRNKVHIGSGHSKMRC